MLLVESVCQDEEGIVQGSYQVRGDEFFPAGAFPGFPVVPGVVLCEIMAQSAGLLVKDKLQEGLLPFFYRDGKRAFPPHGAPGRPGGNPVQTGAQGGPADESQRGGLGGGRAVR